jgi:fumarate reductase subunit C
MSTKGGYTLHHPKWYRRPVSVWWWLQSWRYTRFVLRELSSLSVAYFAMIIVWKIRAFAAGPEAYASFLSRMESALFLLLNAAAFLFVLFHAVTWFNLAPKAMVIRLGGRRVPDWVIQGLNYLVWIVLSVVAVWVLQHG